MNDIETIAEVGIFDATWPVGRLTRIMFDSPINIQPTKTITKEESKERSSINSARISVDDTENADVSIYLTGDWANEVEQYGGRRDGDGLLLCLVRGNSILIEEGMRKESE